MGKGSQGDVVLLKLREGRVGGGDPTIWSAVLVRTRILVVPAIRVAVDIVKEQCETPEHTGIGTQCQRPGSGGWVRAAVNLNTAVQEGVPGAGLDEGTPPCHAYQRRRPG